MTESVKEHTGNTTLQSNITEMVLYIHPGSYYSKIALLAFHEKHLKYKPHFINVFVRENLHPSFLKLNPKGQLPVLQDGEKTISGSDVIIQYLEEKYCNEPVSKLLPPSGTSAFQRVKELVDLIRTFKNSIPTYGVLNFPELSSGITMNEHEHKARLELLHHGENFIDIVQEKFPEMTDLLQKKKQGFYANYEACRNVESIMKENISIEHILDEMEKELSSHSEDQKHWWLCYEHLTEADITLAVFLYRLEELGLIAQFLTLSNRPFLYHYKKRLQQRPGYQSFLSDLDSLYKQVY